MKPHIKEEQETIIKPKCVIAACGHELRAILPGVESLESAGCKVTVLCSNGVGFQHVVTASGKHYGVVSKK